MAKLIIMKAGLHFFFFLKIFSDTFDLLDCFM